MDLPRCPFLRGDDAAIVATPTIPSTRRCCSRRTLRRRSTRRPDSVRGRRACNRTIEYCWACYLLTCATTTVIVATSTRQRQPPLLPPLPSRRRCQWHVPTTGTTRIPSSCLRGGRCWRVPRRPLSLGGASADYEAGVRASQRDIKHHWPVIGNGQSWTRMELDEPGIIVS